MNKKEFVGRYGEGAYLKRLEQTRVWNGLHPLELHQARREQSRSGGKYYRRKQRYERTGLQGERNRIRIDIGG